MKKYILSLFIVFNVFVSFSQQPPAVGTRMIRIASATTVLGQNIPIGTLVLNTDVDKLYLAKSAILSTKTLNTAAANFKLLNPTIINESSSIITTTVDYTTLLTEGGTILVNPAVGLTTTITLTTTGVETGKRFLIKKANSNTGTVKVISETGNIEGNSFIETDVPYQGWILQYDGTNWHMIGYI